MSFATRELYASPNGDRWYLESDADLQQVHIRHQANARSGGAVTLIEIGAFLHPGASGPEHQALIRLIGTLADHRPEIATGGHDNQNTR